MRRRTGTTVVRSIRCQGDCQGKKNGAVYESQKMNVAGRGGGGGGGGGGGEERKFPYILIRYPAQTNIKHLSCNKQPQLGCVNTSRVRPSLLCLHQQNGWK